MRTRLSRGLLILIAVVLVLVLAEGALVAAVFVSPSAGDSLGSAAASADRFWNGSDDGPGVRSKIAGAVGREYRSWIESMWAEPAAPKADADFTRCVRCHPDYATDRRFSDVYMDHPLHAEIGLACETCHRSTAHPNPAPPLETTCARCHSEVNEEGRCGLCHPPASLPHFYLLGAPRDASVECSVCHPKQTFETKPTTPLVAAPHFDGSSPQTCLQCHQRSNCRQCHEEPTHPPGWISQHGASSGQGSGSCTTCHTSTWCAARCHSVTDTNPFEPQPLPTSGVRP